LKFLKENEILNVTEEDGKYSKGEIMLYDEILD